MIILLSPFSFAQDKKTVRLLSAMGVLAGAVLVALLAVEWITIVGTPSA